MSEALSCCRWWYASQSLALALDTVIAEGTKAPAAAKAAGGQATMAKGAAKAKSAAVLREQQCRAALTATNESVKGNHLSPVVHVYVYVYVYVYVCIYVYMYLYICICIYTYTYMHIYLYIYTYVHIYLYIYTYVYIYI